MALALLRLVLYQNSPRNICSSNHKLEVVYFYINRSHALICYVQIISCMLIFSQLMQAQKEDISFCIETTEDHRLIKCFKGCFCPFLWKEHIELSGFLEGFLDPLTIDFICFVFGVMIIAMHSIFLCGHLRMGLTKCICDVSNCQWPKPDISLFILTPKFICCPINLSSSRYLKPAPVL